jgi:hypothetical protein
LVSIRNRYVSSLRYKDASQGSGILPFQGLINHSCDPNLMPIHVDNKFVSIVLKPIAKGEQLFVNYRSTYFSEPRREVRQFELLQDYDFICTCNACWKNLSIYSMEAKDLSFEKPSREIPVKFDDIVEEFEKNCKYINENFNLYPSVEICTLLMRNLVCWEELETQRFGPFK